MMKLYKLKYSTKTIKKPVYTVSARYGIMKEFLSKSRAESYAKSHDGLVYHSGWKKVRLRKVI